MEQFIFTVDQAATALGFKRTHLYELMANGMLAFFKDGKKRYITKGSLEDKTSGFMTIALWARWMKGKGSPSHLCCQMRQMRHQNLLVSTVHLFIDVNHFMCLICLQIPNRYGLTRKLN